MKGLVFAPLVRVSTERQERRGESLRVQHAQLEAAVRALKGTIFKWYEGQEHSTPDHERKILDQLVKDATNKKFDAVMVADLSRWSRDNLRSKTVVEIFKKNGIRFFERGMEYDLHDPTAAFIVGMGVEVQEFVAKLNVKKSMLSRIARAEQGFPSAGRIPWARMWDKENKTWSVDADKKALAESLAKSYLSGKGFAEIEKETGIKAWHAHKILTYLSGEDWKIRFSGKHGTEAKEVIIKIPPLLDKKILYQIRKRAESRRTFRGVIKHHYLLSHMLFDADSGLSLTGVAYGNGRLFYRIYQPGKVRYSIKADRIEKAVVEELFAAGCNIQALKKAVFKETMSEDAQNELTEKKENYVRQIAAAKKKLENLTEWLMDEEQTERVRALFKEKSKALDEQIEDLENGLRAVEDQLAIIPKVRQIEQERKFLTKALQERIKESNLTSGHAFEKLTFDEKRNLLLSLFHGKDLDGKKYGIYVRPLKTKRAYEFEAYGRLGSFEGILLKSYSGDKRDAHHSVGLHQ